MRGPAWAPARWVGILDRIEHREPGVGLRFWGPPLWLEVTMTGPDSDRWPAVSDEATSWDWQSSEPCEVADLADRGADDDHLLAVVSRYTIEQLILNAVHEIGEWFRFDGQRVFPAHTAAPAPSDGEDQGNGAVVVGLTFGAPRTEPALGPAGDAPELLRRLTEVAAPSRFTYLPGTIISYDADGPEVRNAPTAGEPARAWRGAWSSSTVDAVAAGTVDAVALIARDVHTALVSHEADRICRAFHVDGRRPWTMRPPPPARGAVPPDPGAHTATALSLRIATTART